MESWVDAAKPNALFMHCETVYNAMLSESEYGKYEDVAGRIYTGFLTKLFKELGLGVPHYSTVRRELQRMRCIRQIKRGGGTAPSIWLMVKPPTMESYIEMPVQSKVATRAVDRLEQIVRDQTSKLELLDERVRVLESNTNG